MNDGDAGMGPAAESSKVDGNQSKGEKNGDPMVKSSNIGIIVGMALGSTAGLLGGSLGFIIGGSIGVILGETAEVLYLRHKETANGAPVA